MTDPKPRPRWYHLTPGRFVFGLLAAEILLLLSDYFEWFAFNEKKGWAVLIGLAVLGVAVMILLVWLGLALILRRGFRFSLRALLLFVVVCAVVCSWLAVKMREARRQREVVDVIVEAGGEVFYDYHLEIDGFSGRTEPTAPAWLRSLLGDIFFCDVVRVYCEATVLDDNDARQFGDNDARHLTGMTQLAGLYLQTTEITNKGLEHLAGMTQLEELWIASTHITDDGLVHLKGMTKLDFLSLDGTQVTDDGLEHVRALSNLTILNLDGTRVTDNGLEHVRALSNLTSLSLDGTLVTDQGVKKLQETLPNCVIWH